MFDDIPDPTEDLDATPAVHVPASGLEYTAPDATLWRCEQAERLRSDYHLTGSPSQLAARLAEWHAALSPVPGTWNILRRYYGLAPLLGGNPLEDCREWTVREIAAESNLASADIERHLADTQQHWSRSQLQSGLAKRMASGVKTLADDATGRDLMRKYGFDILKDPDDRAFVLTRITELSHLLELDSGRPLALSAIFQEVLIRSIQKRLLDELSKPSATMGTAKLQKEFIEAQSQYEETMKRLGATQEQNPGFRRKVAFVDCLGQIFRAMQDYDERGDTALVDGLFTEAEVRLLLTPTPLRPPQYRPDLALLCQGWKEQFHNPAYDGDKLPTQQARILLAAFEASVLASHGSDAQVAALLGDDHDRHQEEVEEALGLPDASTVEAGAADDGMGEVPDPANVRAVRSAGNDLTPM